MLLNFLKKANGTRLSLFARSVTRMNERKKNDTISVLRMHKSLVCV